MPPKRKAEDDGSLYRPFKSAPKQRKFPQRCTSVKSAATMPGTNEKADSTLTQMGFLSTPNTTTNADDTSSEEDYHEPAALRKGRRWQRNLSCNQRDSAMAEQDMICISSDAEANVEVRGCQKRHAVAGSRVGRTTLGVGLRKLEFHKPDSDEECTPRRDRTAQKRRSTASNPSEGKSRATKKTQDQNNTLTQMVDAWTPVELKPKWEEDWESQFPAYVSPRQQSCRAHEVPKARVTRTLNHSSISKTDNDSKRARNSSVRMAAIPLATRGVCQPTSAERESLSPQTPRKVRFDKEIPSSQTPPSTKLSSARGVRRLTPQRSPLKERSANVRLPIKQPESQTETRKMMEMVRLKRLGSFQKREENAVHDAQPKDDYSSVGLGPTDVKVSPKSSVSKSPQIAGLPEGVVDRHVSKQSRRLFRVATVPDSEDEAESNLPCVPDSNQKPEGEVHEDDYETEHTLDDDEEIFDPAFSALDRDAARAWLTQNQHATERIYDSVDEDGSIRNIDNAGYTTADDATDDDLDRLIMSTVQQSHELGPARLSRPARGVEGDQLQPNSLPPSTPAIDMQVETLKPRDAMCPPSLSAKMQPGKSSEVVEQVECMRSSPPAVQPSQVSTITATQSSSFKTRTTQALSDKASLPQCPPAVWPETASSSPFPLPPWTSPERCRVGDIVASYRESNGGESLHLGSLADFSLVPPPPMSPQKGTPKLGSEN